ncbi:MAG: 2-oxo acid dehydrogenase subunit E2 [Bernardetiaceae bacterium]|nr:2-oxo acid dehydrogenase subunit E2 [Bernardetiaceae bacterium]
MARVEMLMPKMGESVMEGTILTWLKQVGDTIEQDESVLEVATDKVDTEVPAIESGVLVEILAQEGDVVQVGAPIAIIEVQNGQASAADVAQAKTETSQPQTPIATSSRQSETAAEIEKIKRSDSEKFYSPLVRNIAKQEGISLETLDKINGTGKDGRVTKSDIFQYLEQSRTQQDTTTAIPSQQTAITQAQTPPVASVKKESSTSSQPLQPVAPAQSYGNGVEVIEMDRMRRMIAQRMVDSKRISPHVTSFVEADVTNIVNWRNKHKRAVMEREHTSLTFTPIFIEAVIKAIKDFPKINCSVDGNNILLKRDVNVGMAVALPNDNLIVPVIKNADELSLLGITKRVNDLVERARNNKLSPDDLSGGTYTVSNIGSFGNMLGTPIIMQPQVAILSLGAIIKKPAVITTEHGDMIGIRHMMYLSHSYDHRVVDGALGGKFVKRVADYLENFDISRTI